MTNPQKLIPAKASGENCPLDHHVLPVIQHSMKESSPQTPWQCRHFTDVLLVAVVALCTLENDVIHAAYLAIALLLFRRRDVLRTERQSLFRWLPLYNFAVMLLTIAYQAPFENIWGHALQPRLVCSAPAPQN